MLGTMFTLAQSASIVPCSRSLNENPHNALSASEVLGYVNIEGTK